METHNRKRLLSAAYRFAYTRLAMNELLFYESAAEFPSTAVFTAKSQERLAPLLQRFLDGGPDSADELDRLRRHNAERMDVLSSLSDAFLIYEYVLNRQEHRFERTAYAAPTVEEFADRVMLRLAASADASVLDGRLRGIIGQLPVRYTRRTFYGLLRERFAMCEGMDRAGLERLLYVLRSSAMLRLPDDAKEDPEICGILNGLRDTNYPRLDRESYMACRDSFREGIRLLEEKRDACELFGSIINDLYVLFLSRGEAIVDMAQERSFRGVVTGVMRRFEGGISRDGGEPFAKELEGLEGVQEAARERIDFAENEPDADLRKIEKLLSDSVFAELEEEDGGGPADRAWLEEQLRQFCGQLDESFDRQSRPVRRAVMAAVLSRLPVFFSTPEQFRDHVVSSLRSCTDFAEREASMELIEGLLED